MLQTLNTNDLPLLDLQPGDGIDAEEILLGLSEPQKRIAPKNFYDEAGSRLFEQICRQPEYYPTRTELDIMASHADDMADHIGPGAFVVELGSGSSRKTRLLLDSLDVPAGYVPLDISREFLLESAASLAAQYPEIEVLPVCADFTEPLQLPEPSEPPARHVAYFPGSTIGNFSRKQAIALLQNIRAGVGDDGGLLIGVDLLKSADVLEPAYNDAAGVTAAFNLNLLTRLNRELDADFDVDTFRHEAVFDHRHGRIEMRLVSQLNQEVRIGDARLHFDSDEYIVTEHSHKYALDDFADMAAGCGFEVRAVWTDPARLFSVQYLDAR